MKRAATANHLQTHAAAAAGSERGLVTSQAHGNSDAGQVRQRRRTADGSGRLRVTGDIVKWWNTHLGAVTGGVRNYNEFVGFSIG